MFDFEYHRHPRVVWLYEQGRIWLLVLREAGRATLGYQASLMAAAIAYFTLFSMFPLTLVTVAVASIWFEPVTVESEIIQRLEFVAPALGQLLGKNLEQLVLRRGSVTLLSAATLIWSASTVFHVLTRTLDAIWEVDQSRPMWRHRGLAILTTLILCGVLLFVSIIWSAVVPVLNQVASDLFVGFYASLTQILAAAVNALLFTLLYFFLPHMTLSWRDVIPGAIVAGVFWEFAKRAFLFFITNYLSRSNLVYGSVATIVAFLAWVYVTGLIFLFGAHVNVWQKRLRKRPLPAAAEK